jgi:hypothetical protein
VTGVKVEAPRSGGGRTRRCVDHELVGAERSVRGEARRCRQPADRLDLDRVPPRRHRRPDVQRPPRCVGGVSGGDHRARSVPQGQSSGEVRPCRLARRWAQLHRECAVGDIDREDVAVTGGSDVAPRRRSAGHHGRAPEQARVVVGPVSQTGLAVLAVGDDRQIVLEIVGPRILAARPLRHWRTGTGSTAHDRSPPAVATVVSDGGECSVVAEAQRVPHLVRRSLPHGLGRLFVRGVGEHVGGVILPGGEHADQRDPDQVAGVGEVRRCDHDALAVGEVERRRSSQCLHAGVAGRDVDVEGAEVLRHPLPHLEDDRPFLGREARRPVDVERRRRDHLRVTAEAPGGVGCRMAIEVEVDHPAR